MEGWQEEGQVLSWHKEALCRIKTLRTGTLCTDTHAHIYTPSMPILIQWNSEHKHSLKATWVSSGAWHKAAHGAAKYYFFGFAQHSLSVSSKHITTINWVLVPIWVATGMLRHVQVHCWSLVGVYQGVRIWLHHLCFCHNSACSVIKMFLNDEVLLLLLVRISFTHKIQIVAALQEQCTCSYSGLTGN